MLSWGALALGAAALLPSSHASPYQVALTSTSAELDYQPNADGNAALTWNASWTGTPWTSYVRETVPQGMGFHYHNKSDHSPTNSRGEEVWVGYTFVGTRIEYWGYWAYPGQYGQASLNLTDDKGNLLKQASGASGAETNSKNPTMLVSYDFPEAGNHTTRLYPANGALVFTHLVATLNLTGTPEEVSQAASNPTQIWFSDLVTTDADTAVTGLKPDAPLRVDFANGHWKQTPTIGAQGNAPEVTYPRVGTTDTNAQMKFSTGTGNIYIRINGTMAWNHGIFQVDVSPPPPGRRAQEKYWGFTPWSVVNTTYYSTALDPTQNYTFTLTNLNSEGQAASSVWLEPATLTLFKSKTADKSKTNVGAIAGGVVGGVLAIVLIAGAIWFFMRRRNKKTAAVSGRRTSIDVETEPAYGPAPTPFMSEHQPLSPQTYPSPPGTLSAPTESGYTDRTSDYFGGSQYASGSAQPQPIAVGALPRKGGAPPDVVRHPQQAADAGTLHPMAAEEDDMVPPSYNPEWETSSTASLARAGGLAPPQMPEGAHQRNSMQREEPNEADLIKAQFTRRTE